jgi:hypothetical protein
MWIEKSIQEGQGPIRTVEASGKKELTESMEQEIPSLLWNPKIHYHINNRPSLVPLLHQMNPVHTK